MEATATATREWRDLEETLRAHWGYTSLKPEQRAAVTAVVEGHDSIVVLSTGFGKSLCFQLPAACASIGVVAVVTPLLALAEDQLNDLEEHDLCGRLWSSSVTQEDKQRLLEDLSEDEPETRQCRDPNAIAAMRPSALCRHARPAPLLPQDCST